jgi:RNA polymerase sigma-54 factor
MQSSGRVALKPGLSLRVSQHLALTPQLQQSIRLLQLSTLELAQEVEQMLDDNPFLERSDEAAREDFGLPRRTPAQGDDYAADGALTAGAAEAPAEKCGRLRQPEYEPPTGRATAPANAPR